MASGIYTITNTVNGKMYVGCSKNIEKRLANHKAALRYNNHRNIYIQQSWNKYGENAFKFEILQEWQVEYLYSMEHWWCMILNSHNRKYGYNIDPTGPNGKSSVSEETKRKISEKKRGIYVGEKNPFFGKRHTEEFKKRQSDNKKGKVSSRKGTKLHPETVKKMSESMKGTKWTGNTEARKRKQSIETKERWKKWREVHNIYPKDPNREKKIPCAVSVNEIDNEGTIIQTFKTIKAALESVNRVYNTKTVKRLKKASATQCTYINKYWKIN